jgi:hypothetical protein
MEVIAITEAIRAAMQILALVQTAHGSGQPIPKADFDAAVAGRNAALDTLDADIQRARDEGR